VALFPGCLFVKFGLIITQVPKSVIESIMNYKKYCIKV
jgi:hypothetical protein